MQRYNGILAGVLILALAGCATIIHGSTQDVRVSSQPSGAIVRVNGVATTTPGVLKLERKGIYTLVFEKEGYQSVEVQLRKTVDGWLFGNILLLTWGIIGLIIDFSNGAAYKLTPTEVNAVLGEMHASAKEMKGDVLVFVDFDRLPAAVRRSIKERQVS